jgi:hypothetical protein
MAAILSTIAEPAGKPDLNRIGFIRPLGVWISSEIFPELATI